MEWKHDEYQSDSEYGPHGAGEVEEIATEFWQYLSHWSAQGAAAHEVYLRGRLSTQTEVLKADWEVDVATRLAQETMVRDLIQFYGQGMVAIVAMAAADFPWGMFRSPAPTSELVPEPGANEPPHSL